MFRPPSYEAQSIKDAKPNRWYLAYGSNLSSKTFRGRRGIRPLDEVNVVVPTLELTFDLPGIPYLEPCFANVRLGADESQGCEKGDTMFNPSRDIELGVGMQRESQRVLMGVAYLVTPEDFVRIIATEGGGLSYEEKEVECWRISQDRKTLGDRRIIASTLLVPDSGRRSAPMQPSRRYIDIVRAGAREHDMPASYIAYLDSIAYYHITNLRQRTGAALFLATWLIPMLAVTLLSLLFADPKTGLLPRWVATIRKSVTSTMWKSYLRFWKRIFGSGEVTEGSDIFGWYMEPEEHTESPGHAEHQTDVVIAHISTVK